MWIRCSSCIGLAYRGSLLTGLVFAVLPAQGDPIQLVPQGKPDRFQGIKTTGTISSIAKYKVGNVGWYTSTKPLSFASADLLAAQGNENPFLQTLANFGNGWTFTFATNTVLADNTFQIHTYQAQAPKPPASNVAAFAAYTGPDPLYKRCLNKNNCVGAEFYFTYSHPKGSNNPMNVNWIQVLYTNTMGPAAYVVDNGGQADPYYPTSDSDGLFDFPITNTPDESDFFDAMTFLVAGPAADKPGEVTIYGAVDWGYSTQPNPEPDSLLLIVSGIVMLSLLARTRLTLSQIRRTARSS